MIYVETPNQSPVGNKIPSIFLAGGITGCPEWQEEIVKSLKNLEIIVYNPRRKNFPIKDPTAAEAQITWEFNMLRAATIISMWFCKEPIQPICLFELGCWSKTQKPLIVGVDPGYPRQQDVEIQIKLARPDISIVYSLEDLSNTIYKTYNDILPYYIPTGN